MLVINHEGKIVKLRRKATETVMPALTTEEEASLNQRFDRAYDLQTPPPPDPNPAYQVYLQTETEARQSLSPVTLKTRKGDTVSVLPVICRERGAMRELLARDWGQLIDIVALSIAQGDDRINTMQQLAATTSPQIEAPDDYKRFEARFGFDVLAQRDNPKGVFVIADAADAADATAGVFPVDVKTTKNEILSNTNVVISLKTI